MFERWVTACGDRVVTEFEEDALVLIAGRYRLDTSIGRGAMGEVWRAYDETLGRPVAVKLLLAQGADPTAASRFRMEARTAGQLSHPHVVGVLDFGEYEHRLFLVMELVEGDSLARLLAASGPLPAEQVARIAAQAAAGLAAAHRQGIVHRDIKPGNLLLDADGTLKIGDFGIARFLDDPGAALTATGQIVGTSLYLAPERALGRPTGPASDMYSLGCVLYQLLTGRPPFQADTALAILHQHLDNTPVPPRELGVALPPAFENYLLGLLAKQPEDRPTAEQAAEWFGTGAWQGHAEPLPAAAPSATPRTVPPAGETGPATTYLLPSTSPASRRPGRPVRPARPVLVSVIAGAVLFVAALLVGMTWFAPDRSARETSETSPSGTTSPGPAATAATTEPSAAPTPSLPAPATSGSVLAENTKTPETTEKTEKQGKEDRKRKHGDEDDDEGEGD